jgi:lysophospholipase L1-like esterase
MNAKYSLSAALQDRRGENALIVFFSLVLLFGVGILVFVYSNYFNNQNSFLWSISIIASTMTLLPVVVGWYNVIVGGLLLIYFIYASNPPSTNPIAFWKFWKKSGSAILERPPILVCFGDSLTHGVVSSLFTNKIPQRLAQSNQKSTNTSIQVKTNKSYNSYHTDDPIWVISAAQNGFTSHVLVQEERIQKVYNTIFHHPNSTCMNNNKVSLYPNYVLIMIGTNDVLCMTSTFICEMLEKIHKPTGTEINVTNCTVSTFESNLHTLIRTIRSYNPTNNNTSSTTNTNRNNNASITEIGICTIPPLGEDDLEMKMSKNNQNVEKINKVIESVVTCDEFSNDKHITIIPVYNECKKVISIFQKQQQYQEEKKQVNRNDKMMTKINEPNLTFCHLINMIHYASFGIIPRTSTWISGNDNTILVKDNIHLNENGSTIISQLVSNWIIEKRNY